MELGVFQQAEGVGAAVHACAEYYASQVCRKSFMLPAGRLPTRPHDALCHSVAPALPALTNLILGQQDSCQQTKCLQPSTGN